MVLHKCVKVILGISTLDIVQRYMSMTTPYSMHRPGQEMVDILYTLHQQRHAEFKANHEMERRPQRGEWSLLPAFPGVRVWMLRSKRLRADSTAVLAAETHSERKSVISSILPCRVYHLCYQSKEALSVV
jgi:hypothetical protein